jgi:hypothetical protein
MPKGHAWHSSAELKPAGRPVLRCRSQFGAALPGAKLSLSNETSATSRRRNCLTPGRRLLKSGLTLIGRMGKPADLSGANVDGERRRDDLNAPCTWFSTGPLAQLIGRSRNGGYSCSEIHRTP